MNKGLWIMWGTVLTAGATGLAATARSASAAHSAAWNQVAGFRALSDRVSEYDSIQLQTARWAAAPADASLAQEISAVLSSAGLPASALGNLSPDDGTAVPGSPGLMQLRAGLTLSNVTLPQLGRFLTDWRRRQAGGGAGWTITAIDLAPEPTKTEARGSGSASGGGGDLPLQAVMSMESIVTDGVER